MELASPSAGHGASLLFSRTWCYPLYMLLLCDQLVYMYTLLFLYVCIFYIDFVFTNNLFAV